MRLLVVFIYYLFLCCLFQGHISIQKGLNIPPPQKCNNCCYPSRFHCPFCLPTFFKPSKRSRARIHLSNHLKRAIYFGGKHFYILHFKKINCQQNDEFLIKCIVYISEYTIHRCGLGCRKQQHYHCLYCTATLLRKRDFTNHLPYCHQAEQRRAQKGSLIQKAVTQRRVQTKELIASSLTPGESDIPSYEIVRQWLHMMPF